MKWGKFQKFEKWTFPVDTDILKVIIEKYYGVGQPKEETPTPQPTPSPEKEEFKVGDVYLDKLSQGKLKITEVGLKEIMVLIEIGNYLDTYNKVYARLMIERGDWVKIIDEEKEEQLPFKEGDKFLLTINSGDTTLTILDVDEKDVKVQYADGSKGLFELDTAKSRVERGVWKKVLDEEKKEQFKAGDVYYSKLFKQKLTIDRVQEDTIFVDYEDDSSERYTPTYAKLMVQRGDWVKVIDEEIEGGTEEEIKKAIAALEILAEDGDEDAKKGIEALKILLN
jgi:hypothetical protein